MSIDSSPGCVDLMVDRHVRAGRGDCVALIERGAEGRRVLSYRQLQALSLTAARELDLLLAGRRPGQRVALVGSATLETVIYWLAAMRSQRLAFMVHPDLPAEHYEDLWQSYDPDLILADRTARQPRAEAMTDLATLAARKSAPPAAHAVGDIEASFDLSPALVLATSGSTGRPKLCAHSHRSFWEFERTVTRPMWGLCAEDRVLASTGPFFSFGLQGLHAPLSVGASAVLLPEWGRHADFLDAIEAESVTAFLAVPTLYHLLMARAERAYDFSARRLSFSAGERLPPAIRQRWEAWTGSRMLDSIGTTETFAPYLSETVDGGAGLRRVEGFRYLETPHAGDADAPSEAFTLDLSGGCMMLGYLRPGEAGTIETAPASFPTRDLFVRASEGLSFVSRDSERIKVAGYWVSPQELEAFLLDDKRVLKAAALPVVTAEGLTRLRAYVVTTGSGCSGAALVEDLLRRVQHELWPKALRPDRIELVADIATTPSGKLRRQELQGLVNLSVAIAGVVLAD
ncbi:class I adenylate-forming enzyme family protein [Chromobacterium haemolyticum]|uniref:class I adenylate-forming enzyme family protein n=1 Tax=Chromobacterium haemolyticum TaxID=394935 RepID=UPI00244AEE43|nr:AMP-binding protein [Chromobacterium haemolyticum]MDH0343556.1 AMP-binding protein [Chromobacterium haemolyticum]